MVRSPARPTRRTGSLALAVEKQGEGYVLNTGGAYGGEYHLTGAIRLRTRRGTDELVMLREHDRARIVGAWTGARVDGRRVVASGLRWAETPDAQEARALVDGGFLSAASIGFSGRWRYRDELKAEELKALAAEGADLTRLQAVIDDVEVYEASLVAVGADEGARWSLDEHLDSGLDEMGDAQQLMVKHLVAHHDMSEDDAMREVMGLDPEAEPGVNRAPAAPVADAAAEEAPADPPTDDGALYDVPSEVRAAAQQGLDWREEYGRGGTASGVRTARALTSGRVEPELLLTIAAWWARFAEVEGPMEDGGEPTALAIARALWGGDTARGWADGLADDARAEVEGEAALSAAAAPTVSPAVLSLLSPTPAASGITHLLSPTARR
jgi:phage head maturation protease